MRFSICAFSLPAAATLVLPFVAPSLVLGLGRGHIRFGLVLAHDLFEAGCDRGCDVAEHLAAELRRHEGRAEPAGSTRLELGDGVHHFRNELDAFSDRRSSTCAAVSDFCCAFLLRVHQLLELRVDVLNLHVHVFARQVELGQLLLDLAHLLLPDVAHGIEQRRLVRRPQ